MKPLIDKEELMRKKELVTPKGSTSLISFSF